MGMPSHLKTQERVSIRTESRQVLGNRKMIVVMFSALVDHVCVTRTTDDLRDITQKGKTAGPPGN